MTLSNEAVVDADLAPALTSPHLIAYPLQGQAAIPTPAPRWRDWADMTRQRFANRCLPILIANQAGWQIAASAAVEVTWTGGPGIEHLTVRGDGGQRRLPARSHFGHGILTWTIPFLFRTSPGYNLLVRGPANYPKDGISALEGVVETDWAVAPFTMNWKVTRPGVTIRFEEGEPVCMIVPQRRGELESFETALKQLDECPDADFIQQHRDWRKSRAEFNARLKAAIVPARQAWQKHYFRGTGPNGSPAPEHQTLLRLRHFEEE